MKNVKYDNRPCVGNFNIQEINLANNCTSARPNHLSSEIVRYIGFNGVKLFLLGAAIS